MPLALGVSAALQFQVACGANPYILVVGAETGLSDECQRVSRHIHILVLCVLLLLAEARGARAWSGEGPLDCPGNRILTSSPVPAWRGFHASVGRGWTGVFEPDKGLVHRACGPPIDLNCGVLRQERQVESACRAFIRNRTDLFGVGESKLALSHARQLGRVW